MELSVINSMDIGNKARELYNLKYEQPENIISKRYIDFKYMEKLAVLYNK